MSCRWLGPSSQYRSVRRADGEIVQAKCSLPSTVDQFSVTSTKPLSVAQSRGAQTRKARTPS